ncbi:hypothetical protein BS47DRAFT_1360471 [Hydnum rufescens UP504]|uniref:Uncharacterized protein n=1 Tax=Hydnum rufescens UP504 TaxID=1448309 RepID=A0A9P6B264_9AGAM|nr:hypothetical protein BS47DRAFT_1360471 [Hydnum rufescens UP504]
MGQTTHPPPWVCGHLRSCSSLNEYIPENPPAPLSPVRKTDGGGCATAGQNEYHTPAKVGSELTREMENQAQTTRRPWYKMSTTHPLQRVCGTTRIQIEAPEMTTCDSSK